MSKFGSEKLANVMADSILEFVSSAIDNQLDNLDISDKIDNAIDESDLESKIESAVSDFDFSAIIDDDLILSNVNLDCLFQDWLDNKFEKQIEPALDSIKEDIETNGKHFAGVSDLTNTLRDEILTLTARLDYLERDFNRILADKLRDRPSVLARVWARIRGLFVKIGG